jgi:hypothetical protein
MTMPENGAEYRDPKFDIAYDPALVVRFEYDHAEGPSVGFVNSEDGSTELVILNHTVVSHPVFLQPDGAYEAYILTEPEKLIYTPGEWVAFYAGVKNGEFQEDYDNPHGAYIRDSKDTDSHIFVFTANGFRAFIDGIMRGKYDLTSEQETLILESWAPSNSEENESKDAPSDL